MNSEPLDTPYITIEGEPTWPEPHARAMARITEHRQKLVDFINEHQDENNCFLDEAPELVKSMLDSIGVRCETRMDASKQRVFVVRPRLLEDLL